MNRRGITLIEVLTAMLIIGVLAAMLFPVLTQGRYRAKESVCVSNVRQLALAMKAYADDSGDFPPAYRPEALFAFSPGTESLKCFSQENRDVVNDYILHGPPTGNTSMERSLQDDYRKCREVRGSDFPIVSDENHTGKVYGYTSGKQFYILARESGAVTQVPAARYLSMLAGKEPAPCNIDLVADNL